MKVKAKTVPVNVEVDVDPINFLFDLRHKVCRLRYKESIKDGKICEEQLTDYHKGEYDDIPIADASSEQIELYEACSMLIQHLREKEEVINKLAR